MRLFPYLNRGNVSGVWFIFLRQQRHCFSWHRYNSRLASVRSASTTQRSSTPVLSNFPPQSEPLVSVTRSAMTSSACSAWNSARGGTFFSLGAPPFLCAFVASVFSLMLSFEEGVDNPNISKNWPPSRFLWYLSYAFNCWFSSFNRSIWSCFRRHSSQKRSASARLIPGWPTHPYFLLMLHFPMPTHFKLMEIPCFFRSFCAQKITYGVCSYDADKLLNRAISQRLFS